MEKGYYMLLPLEIIQPIKCPDSGSARTSVVGLRLQGMLVLKQRWNVELLIMEERDLVSLIAQILQRPTCVRKRDYWLGIEINKDNIVKGSAEKRQEKEKSKGGRSLDEIQHLWFSDFSCSSATNGTCFYTNRHLYSPW